MLFWFQVMSSNLYITQCCYFNFVALLYLPVFILIWSVVFVDAFSAGSPLSDQVHQTPAHMYNETGETAIISCSHSIQSYDRILWYKQSNGQLQYLGYIFKTDGKPETGMGVKIEGSADKDQTCTLTIEGLNLSSSAVYFCAASYHSATYHCSSVQKPPHHIFFISVLQLTASLHLCSFLS